MIRNYLILLFLIIVIGMVYFFTKTLPMNLMQLSAQNQDHDQNVSRQNFQNNQNISDSDGFQLPLDRAAERVTKKPFGIYITPQNSPVQPERFRGYHTGTDFEIFPEELNADVPVRAVCSGKVVLKTYAGGYGGVLVQSCELDNQPITIIYGHLNAGSIRFKLEDIINKGDNIGNLGMAYSMQTDGERKHLHLGFHKGTSINITGYVPSEDQLPEWIDPCQYVCQ